MEEEQDEQQDEAQAIAEDDEAFDRYVAEAESRVKAEDEAEAADAVAAAAVAAGDEELRAFTLAEIEKSGSWEHLPASMIGQLSDEAFEAFAAWRSEQPADEEPEDYEPSAPSPLDDVGEPASRYLTMTDAEFAAELKALQS